MTQTSSVESLYQEELYLLKPKVLVILSQNWEQISPEDQLLLGKILGSVKFGLDAVQIITLKEFNTEDLKAFVPQKVIAFGSSFRESQNLYELLSVRETLIIQADTLDQLDDAKKKRLWGGLRQMFTL